MNIINTNLKFGTLSYKNKPEMIVLHHAAVTNCTVEDIHKWHLNRDWAGIGYHYYVRKDGKIYRGRPENAVGAHCPTVNAKSIGICAEGNFEADTMPEAQKSAIIELCRDIRSRYKINDIKAHREIKATACPGKNYSFAEIKQSALQNVEKSKAAGTAIDNDTLNLQKTLNRLKIRDEKGNALAEDGKYGPLTKSAVRRFQEIMDILVDGKAGPQTWGVINQILTKPVIKKGAKNVVVRYIQYRVGAAIDGSFGPETDRKVREWQKKNGLVADGSVGPKTWNKLIG